MNHLHKGGDEMSARLPNMAIVSRTCVLCLALAAGQAAARDYIVDQKHPAASDKNPGTLAAPLKTIQAALDKAQPGDSVQVRGGVYHESVKFKRGGSYPGGAIETSNPQGLKWLTLEAYQDEHVVLDGAVTIPADKWQLVKGRRNVYWTPWVGEEQEGRRINLVLLGETMIMPSLANVSGKNASHIFGAPSSLLPAMPGDRPADEGYYYDHRQKKLFVNLGVRVPGKDAEVRAAQLLEGVDAASQSYVRIRKLEVRNYISTGIVVYNTHECLVEDNSVHHCGHGLWCSPSSGGVIRHNTFADIMGIGIQLAESRGTIVEENVVKRTHLNPYKIVAWDGSAVICNAAFGLVLRNNVITDCADATGVWPDVLLAGPRILRQHDLQHARLRLLHRAERDRRRSAVEYRIPERRAASASARTGPTRPSRTTPSAIAGTGWRSAPATRTACPRPMR